jgi:hypothetical protein
MSNPRVLAFLHDIAEAVSRIQYFGVNLDIVWQVIQDDLPALLIATQHLIAVVTATNTALEEP